MFRYESNCFSLKKLRIADGLATRHLLQCLPVSDGKVLLLLQGVHEGDEEVLVVEKRGEQSDALLHVGPRGVVGLQEWDDT